MVPEEPPMHLITAQVTEVPFTGQHPKPHIREQTGQLSPPRDDCLIAADPDVAGIGVRVAVYLQALLPLVAIAFIPHSSIHTVDVKLAEQYCERGNGSLVVFSTTSAALLVTAFIKRAQRALSPYHALLVLNFTWIILISSCCRAAVVFYVQKHRIPESFVQQLAKGVQERVRNRSAPSKKQTPLLVGPSNRALFYKFSRHATVLCWHLLATGALGWMLFSDIEGFAGPAGCPCDTLLWTFASPVHVADPTPRRFWRIVYMMTLLSPFTLPVLCFIVCFLFNLAAALLCALGGKVSHKLPFRQTRGADSPARSSALSLRAFEALSVALLVLLIVSTEETIARNPVDDSEDAWGFGQVLALLLAASALYESVGDLRMSLQLRRASKPRGEAGQYTRLP